MDQQKAFMLIEGSHTIEQIAMKQWLMTLSWLRSQHLLFLFLAGWFWFFWLLSFHNMRWTLPLDWEKGLYSTTIGRNWRGVRERTSEIKSWICSFAKGLGINMSQLDQHYLCDILRRKNHFLFCSFCDTSSYIISKVGDLGALVTAPYRFVRLASITKAIWTALGWSMRWVWLTPKL